ncbi:MAG: hypothetical protein HYX22_01380 [Candidatus Yanofskybacteria bacterium]|nr:hypothetical protein [Candidatus Yanofskybacteria bacterium]
MAKIGRIFKKINQLKPSGFWPGFLVGLVYFSYIFWWFWSVHHLAASGIESGFLAFLIILLPFIITVTGVSLFWGGFSYIAVKFSRRLNVAPLSIFIAGTFVLLEYARAWFFGILWFGKGSLLGPHWTLGNLAYLFTSISPIRESSAWWGIYGIDFLVLLFSTALFLLIRDRRRKHIKSLTLVLFFVIAIFIAVNLAPQRVFERNETTVSVIQTKKFLKTFYEPDELLDDFGKKIELLKEAAKNSEIIVFPENADFSKTLSGFLDNSSVQKFFNNLSDNKVLIIDGNRVTDEKGIKSKTLLIDSKRGVADFYDKKLLTPGGESLPYIAALPLLAFEKITGNNFVSSGTNYTGGTENNILYHNDLKVGLAVCSDIISPDLIRNNAPELLINTNNLAVFNGNPLIAGQLLSIARFRAAENGKYLIISSNFGFSHIIDPLGNIVKSADSTGYQILTGNVVLNQTRTWYNKLGDWPILLLSLVIFGFGLIKLRNTRLYNSPDADQNKNFY